MCIFSLLISLCFFLSEVLSPVMLSQLCPVYHFPVRFLGLLRAMILATEGEFATSKYAFWGYIYYLNF